MTPRYIDLDHGYPTSAEEESSTRYGCKLIPHNPHPTRSPRQGDNPAQAAVAWVLAFMERWL